MFVSDLMKYDVTAVAPGTTLADAARMMICRHVSGLPVVEEGRLIGIVTEGDLLRRAEIETDKKNHSWIKSIFLPGSLADEFVHTHGRYVRDVLTAPAISVSPDTSLADAAAIMSERHIKRLPVLDGGKLVGIISRTDMLGVLARRLADKVDHFTDAEIKQHILTTLKGESWAPKATVSVDVSDGVVDLEGVIFNDAERRGVRVIVETTPGVKEVRDHLRYVDPTSGISIPFA